MAETKKTATQSQLLMSITGREVSRGSYNPKTTKREISLRGKSSSDLNDMVSFHESYHSFLNGSTTFGIAMMFCGSLIKLNERPFAGCVSEMIEHTILTHETYATVHGLLTASRGDVSSSLLNDFPAYQSHLDRFIDIFEPEDGIGLANMALANAARAAMQTPVFTWLLETPCEQWYKLPLDTWNDPDLRFKALLKPDIIREAKEAMFGELMKSSSTLNALTKPDCSSSDQWNAISRAESDDFVPVYQAAFKIFSKKLEQLGFNQAGYDDQREQLSVLISKVEIALGPDSNKTFLLPKEGEDYETVMGDFRREVLSIRDHELPLFITDLKEQEPNVIQVFVHKGNSGQHLQFVSMPLQKAERLFQITTNSTAVKRLNTEHLTGFRRLARTPEYQVEFLNVSENEARNLIENIPEVKLYNTVSLVTSRDQVWLEHWTGENKLLSQNLGIIIDDDPIFLMNQLALEGVDVNVFGGRMEIPVENQDSIVLDFIAFIKTNEPQKFYFTPCTLSLRTAILKLADDKGKPFTIERDLPEQWQNYIVNTFFNLVQEEGRFGAAFWISR